MNPVSKSLNDILPELSSQVTNLHSDINSHQNTSMNFLFSKFHQINDNVVTVKNDVAFTTNIIDMRNNFKYFSIYEIGYNSLEYLSDEIINPSHQVVNENSSKTSKLDNITNEVHAQDSNDVNKNKEHENVCPQ